MLDRQRLVIVLGAVVAFVLQIVLAPVLTLFSSQPNILLAYVLVVAIICPGESGPVLPFTMGLLYDLTGTGPVGAMALLFLVASFIASRIFTVFGNDTLFMSFAIFGAMALLVELAYAGLLVSFGINVGLFEAFAYRALPCALYECVIGIILYPIMMRLLSRGSLDRGLHEHRLR